MSNDSRDQLETIDTRITGASMNLPLGQRLLLLAVWQAVFALLNSLIDRIEKLEKEKSP